MNTKLNTAAMLAILIRATVTGFIVVFYLKTNRWMGAPNNPRNGCTHRDVMGIIYVWNTKQHVLKRPP